MSHAAALEKFWSRPLVPPITASWALKEQWASRWVRPKESWERFSRSSEPQSDLRRATEKSSFWPEWSGLIKVSSTACSHPDGFRYLNASSKFRYQCERPKKKTSGPFQKGNKCLYFRLPMQAAIIIIMVKHSCTVKKIQLYMYIEKGWLAELIKITIWLNWNGIDHWSEEE